MENSKVQLSPQEVFNNKKIFSNKIHARVLQVIEEVLKFLDNLKFENIEEKKLFLNTVNHYYRDICVVIFHLRQVAIKIDDDDQAVRDLRNVITELNKTVIFAQDYLNFEIEELKVRLKGSIVDVGSQIEQLMKIVEYDNLHEYKQQVLDCQHDLVISTKTLKFYFQISELSYPEIEVLLHDELDKIKNNLIKIKTGHDLYEEDFSHYTRHYVHNLHNILNYMKKTIHTEHFPKDVINSFQFAEVWFIKSGSELLEAVRYGNSMKRMLEHLENWHNIVRRGSLELRKGFQVAKEKNLGKKEIEKTNQLIFHIGLDRLNAMHSLNLCFEDVIMNK